MKGNKLIILGLTFFLMAGLFAPLAVGENDSLHVVMTVADRNYSVGDTITIQLLIYDKGVPTDLVKPQDAYLGMSTNYGLANPFNMTVTKQDTGIYQSTYTIKASDANQHLHFFYDVTLGNDREGGQASIDVYSIQDTVDMTIGGQKSVPARPGDTLKAIILVRTGATPIPVSGFTQLYLESPQGIRQNLTQVEKEVGIYEVEFLVPMVSVSGTYELVAQPMGMGDTDTAYIHVNVLDVWYHKISTGGDTVSFEVCVADNDGTAVEGANFYIQRDNWPNDEYFGITNASGRFLVHVSDLTGQIGFTGYVLASGLNQTISGAVFNYAADQPDHNDFDILWEGTETVFKPNTNVAIPYGAYMARLPASSKTIYYYVTATGTEFAMMDGTGFHQEIARNVIAAGAIITDSLGKMLLEFKTPAEQCEIDVRFEVPLDKAGYVNQTYDLDDGMYYEVWPENAWNTDGFIFYAYEGKLDGDKDVSLSIGSFKPGKLGIVTVDTGAELGDAAIVLWSVGEGSLADMDRYDPEWFRWVPAGNIILLQENEKGAYQGDFMLPKFITGQDITVVAGHVDSDGVPHFDAKTASPGSGIPWLWIIVIIVIIVIMIAIIAVAKVKMII